MPNYKKLLAVFVIVLMISAVHSYLMVSNDGQLRTLRKQSLQIERRVRMLQQEIGYGGLIHLFKNYLLRPSEDLYYQQFVAKHAVAMALIESLESEQVGTFHDNRLPKTRKMITEYRQRLDQVRSLHQQNLSAREIDRVVRFDDSPALTELEDLADQLEQSVENERFKLVTINRYQLIANFVLGLAFLTGFAWLIIKQRRREVTDQMERFQHDLDLLAEKNEALSGFARIVSHDLKAPVRNISQACELITRKIDDQAYVRKRISTIGTTASILTDLIDCLLEFSSSGFRTPKYASFDMNSLIADVCEEIKKGHSSCEIQLESVPNVAGDPGLLREVFLNLMSNSLKYQPPEQAAIIRLTGQQDETNALFFLQDNGIGIDPQYAETIFQPLKRLHGADSPYPGHGIGLTLVRNIIEAHGGDIMVDSTVACSEFPTCFRITLPIHRAR